MNRHLHALTAEGARLVTAELARGDVDRYDEAECAACLRPLPRAVSLEELDAVVAEAFAKFGVGDPRLDTHLAERVHATLPLTRREAADVGVFRYLAVVRHPALVRLRWPYRSLATSRSRFLNAGTRHDSNAFSRWWWIAELTRDGDDYALTRAVLGRSALATHLFSRGLSQHRPLVEAFVEVLGDAAGPDVEAAIRIVGKMSSVRVIEAMDRAELEAMISRARDLSRVRG